MKHLLACALLTLAIPASATVITSTVGNSASGLADGQLTDIFDMIAAQSGQLAPFDQGYGNDLLEDFSQGWVHNFGALTDPIISASITIGIAEHDSAYTGSQLALFGFDTVDLTTGMDTLFEGSGGADTEYNIYQLALGASAFGDLLDGFANFSLTLSGQTESCGLFPPCQITDFNGAHLIFSTLSIETQDTVPTPAPPTLLLVIIGGLALLWRRRTL